MGRVYFIQGEDTKRIKIGFTTNSVDSRVSALQTGSGEKHKVLKTVPGTKADETAYHEKFREFRLHGEWFQPSYPIMQTIRLLGLVPLRRACVEHHCEVYWAKIEVVSTWAEHVDAYGSMLVVKCTRYPGEHDYLPDFPAALHLVGPSLHLNQVLQVIYADRFEDEATNLEVANVIESMVAATHFGEFRMAVKLTFGLPYPFAGKYEAGWQGGYMRRVPAR